MHSRINQELISFYKNNKIKIFNNKIYKINHYQLNNFNNNYFILTKYKIINLMQNNI